MAENSWFFDSATNDDREYDQKQLALTLHHVATSDGVSKLDYENPLGCSLMPDSSISVNPGVMEIQGFTYYNDSILSMPAQDYLQGEVRTDRIVIRLDRSSDVRNAYAAINLGTAGNSSPPELNRSGDIYELGLALLQWDGAVLTAVDTRLDYSACGYLGGDYASSGDLTALEIDLNQNYAKKTQVLDAILLSGTSWTYATDHYEQTITVDGVNNADYIYTPYPAPSSVHDYSTYGLAMQDPAVANKVTFYAVDQPPNTIYVRIKKEQ